MSMTYSEGMTTWVCSFSHELSRCEYEYPSPVYQNHRVFDAALRLRDVGEGAGTIVHWNIKASAFWHDYRREGELSNLWPHSALDFSSSQAVKNLIMAYLSPHTADNQELRQCLTFFFPVYSYSSSANQRCMREVGILLIPLRQAKFSA